MATLREWFDHPGSRSFAALLSARVAESGAQILNGISSRPADARKLSEEQAEALETASRYLLVLETFRALETLCQDSDPEIVTSLVLTPHP